MIDILLSTAVRAQRDIALVSEAATERVAAAFL